MNYLELFLRYTLFSRKDLFFKNKIDSLFQETFNKTSLTTTISSIYGELTRVEEFEGSNCFDIFLFL